MSWTHIVLVFLAASSTSLARVATSLPSEASNASLTSETPNASEATSYSLASKAISVSEAIEATGTSQASEAVISSFLWRINTAPPSYLFGTIHVPYTKVWDAVNDSAKAAFNGSSHLYLEVAIRNDSTVDQSFKLLANGQNISEILPEDVYAKLKLRVEHIRRDIETWLTPEKRLQQGLNASAVFDALFGDLERMQPLFLITAITTVTQRYVSTYHIPILDKFLNQQAILQHKQLGSLETSQDRFLALKNIDLDAQVFTLNTSLTVMNLFNTSAFHVHADHALETIIENYRRGIFDGSFNERRSSKNLTLEQQMQEKFKAGIEEWMVQERSKNMGEAIVDVLTRRKPGDSFFFAVGAAHYSGRHRMQEVVRAAGFSVDHVDPDGDVGFVGSRDEGNGASQGLFVNGLLLISISCLVVLR